jgi:hypothetical protein
MGRRMTRQASDSAACGRKPHAGEPHRPQHIRRGGSERFAMTCGRGVTMQNMGTFHLSVAAAEATLASLLLGAMALEGCAALAVPVLGSAAV